MRNKAKSNDEIIKDVKDLEFGENVEIIIDDKKKDDVEFINEEEVDYFMEPIEPEDIEVFEINE